MISADGELNAARALKEAAETIASSRTAMQLRYLQTLNIIAAERGSTIMFPIPIDILGGMQGGMMEVSPYNRKLHYVHACSYTL